MDLRLRLRLRRPRATKAMAPNASKAATPPIAPPAIAPMCDFDFVPVVTGLAVIRWTGALINSKSEIKKLALVINELES